MAIELSLGDSDELDVVDQPSDDIKGANGAPVLRISRDTHAEALEAVTNEFAAKRERKKNGIPLPSIPLERPDVAGNPHPNLWARRPGGKR